MVRKIGKALALCMVLLVVFMNTVPAYAETLDNSAQQDSNQESDTLCIDGEPSKNGYLPGASPDNWTDEGHDTDYVDNGGFFLRAAKPGKSQMTLKGLVLFVDFPNKLAENASQGKNPKDFYDQVFPNGTLEFMQEVSYGKLKLEVTPHLKWLHMSKPDSEYLQNENGIFTTHSHSLYIKEAIERAQADGLDCTKYDIFYIIPVDGASFADHNNATYSYIDDSKAYPQLYKNPYIKIKNKYIYHAVTLNGNSRNPFLVKHETAHLFGLPDCYTFLEGYGQFNFVGSWDPMSNGSGSYLAWHKWKLGWLQDNQVDVVTKKGTTVHQLTPLGTPGGKKCIVVRTGKYETYVAEYRTRTGVDKNIDDTGVLIYKVDSSIMSGYGQALVIDAKYGLDRQLKATGISNQCCYTIGEGRNNTFTDLSNGVTIKVTGISGDKAAVMVTREGDVKLSVPVVLQDAYFISPSEIQVNTNVQMKYAPYTELVMTSPSGQPLPTINGTLTKENIMITKQNGKAVPVDKITSVVVTENKVNIKVDPSQLNGDTTGTTVATKAFYYYSAGKAVPVRQSVLKGAQFIGLTQIIANTNTKLTGITAKDIVITSGSYTVPAEMITNISVEDDKVIIDLDPAAFASESSSGAVISTKAFGSFKASAGVVISPSSEPLDPAIWGAARQPETKRRHLMIVVDFPDAKAADNTEKKPISGKTTYCEGNLVNGHVLKTAQDYYDWFMPSASNWYKNSSYGKLDLEVTLVKNPASADGVFTCNKKLADYINEGSGDNIPTDALEIAKDAIKNLPGGPYDCIYVVSVENAGLRGSWADPYNTSAAEITGRKDLHGLVKIGFDAYVDWKYKVVVHETGHILGMGDYYLNWFSGYGGGQCDPVTGRADYYPLVGHYSLMGYTNGPAPDLFSVLKRSLGWIRDDQIDVITADGTTKHQLTPIETAGGTKSVYILSNRTAYVLEYRHASGVDNTGVTEVSTDPNPDYPNTNWTHPYGTFHSAGILLYKISPKGGNITIADLYPDNTTKELGTALDYSVLGASSNILTYTDPAAGITISLDKETDSVDTITVTKKTPAEKIKPVLSEAKFIEGSTIEFKTEVDLRGIDSENIVLKKGSSEISGINLNQITPRTVRVTFNNGQFKDAADTEGVTLYTKAFSFFGSSEPVKVSPLYNLAKPVLSEAKFNGLTELEVKSDMDLTGYTAANIAIKRADGSYVDTKKITNINFNADKKVLTVTVDKDQFVKNSTTKDVAIAVKLYSNFRADKLDLSMAKFNPPVTVIDPSMEVSVTALPSAVLNSIEVDTSLAKTVYAVGDELNIRGLVVKGSYSDGSQEILPITPANIEGFDSSSTAVDQDLTIKYDGKTAKYMVAITPKPDSIEISTPAAKTSYYIGEPLDISGMVVMGNFGTEKKPVTISPADITGFDSSKAINSQVLTVAFGRMTVTYTVSIKVMPGETLDTNSYYKLVNRSSSGIMDGDSGNDTVVYWDDYTLNYPNHDMAEWRFIDAGNFYYKLLNKGSGNYLKAVGNDIHQGTDPKDDSGLWIVQKAENSFKITNKATGKVLDVPDTANGTVIIQSDYTGTNGQLWTPTIMEAVQP